MSAKVESPDTVSAAKARRVFALVGNPNCGKTTLFNALTGLRQRVTNYPGVTVERKEGTCFSQHGEEYLIIDLPGAYSLKARSPDEEILRDVILGRRKDSPKPDAVICVLDASNAERNLFLASQIIELGVPVILALNMTDVAEARKIHLDPQKLSDALGVPVIPMQANARKGIIELRIAMSHPELQISHHKVALPEAIEKAINEAGDKTLGRAALYIPEELKPHGHHESWEDHLIASRYETIQQICEEVVRHHEPDSVTMTDRLDAIFLHKFWGWAAMAGILGLLFFLIFRFAEYPMGWIESLFGAASDAVTNAMPEGDLRDLITDGVIAGVGGVVIFLPQIIILFFFIGVMEDTGYMSRVAFMMDRAMSKVGLSGKSFIPLLSSYACAVPGIMGTRTVENPKDRLITILVAPFASCTARVPVYLLMIATIVPAEKAPALTKAGYMLGLYLLGTIGIFVFAAIFNKVLKRRAATHQIIELPTYKRPSMKAVGLHLWERSFLFVRRAGTIILGISILLWALETYPKQAEGDAGDQLAQSYAGRMGKAIEPVIEPLGFDWRCGIGLVMSFAAREVFVSAMSVTFHVEDADNEEAAMTELRHRMKAATRDDGTQLFTPLVCLSLMVFYVFAMQCVSTLAIVRRETNSWRWPLFQLGYMTVVAYLASLIVYQGGRLLGFS